MFVESIHFMITIVTIYRIVLERNTLQGTSFDWVCIVGGSFSLALSHGFIVFLSFLLCIGNRIVIEFPKIVKSIKVWTNEIFFYGITGWCYKWNLLLWHHWMMFEWPSDLPFHYSWVGILLWWMLPFNSALLNTVVLEFINVRIGSGCESMAWLIQNC